MPRGCGLHKTLYNRFVRWSRPGVLSRIFADLAADGDAPERLMIDSTHLKAHRPAASLAPNGGSELRASRRLFPLSCRFTYLDEFVFDYKTNVVRFVSIFSKRTMSLL